MKGKRVRVLGNDDNPLSEDGTYVGDVTVYIRVNADGTISSHDEPESEPEGEGWKLIHNNPKIILDSGQVVYGCQVWWKPIPSVEIAIVLPTDTAEILNENNEKISECFYLGNVEVFIRGNAAAIACGNKPEVNMSLNKPNGEGWLLLDGRPRIVLNNGEIVVHDTLRFRLKDTEDTEETEETEETD